MTQSQETPTHVCAASSHVTKSAIFVAYTSSCALSASSCSSEASRPCAARCSLSLRYFSLANGEARGTGLFVVGDPSPSQHRPPKKDNHKNKEAGKHKANQPVRARAISREAEKQPPYALAARARLTVASAGDDGSIVASFRL